MKVQVYQNQYGDRAIVVGKEFIIYDKVDRLLPECCDYTDNRMSLYIKNGFKEVPDES